MRTLALILALAVWPAALTAQSAADDEAAIRDVVKRYVDARESRDEAAVTRLFAESADQLVSNGEWRRGRAALVKGAMASSQRNSGRRTITVETIRMIAPGVAIADGRYEIAAASGAEPRRMWATFVMRKSGADWKIEAIRNMLPAQ